LVNNIEILNDYVTMILMYTIFTRKTDLYKGDNKMITIQEKSIKYAKKVEGSFLIRSYTNSVTC
jgi:hypothetical protein